MNYTKVINNKSNHIIIPNSGELIFVKGPSVSQITERHGNRFRSRLVSTERLKEFLSRWPGKIEERLSVST